MRDNKVCRDSGLKRLSRTGEEARFLRQRGGFVLGSHAKLATRNVQHFEEIASSLVNPWEA